MLSSITCCLANSLSACSAVLSKDEWVRGSFVRDQDVTVDMGVMTDVFHRILSLNGSAEAFVNATAARPDFAVLRQ